MIPGLVPALVAGSGGQKILPYCYSPKDHFCYSPLKESRYTSWLVPGGGGPYPQVVPPPGNTWWGEGGGGAERADTGAGDSEDTSRVYR